MRRIEQEWCELDAGVIMAESREFRTMLETKERELVALCDQQIQALNSQVRLVSVSPHDWY